MSLESEPVDLQINTDNVISLEKDISEDVILQRATIPSWDSNQIIFPNENFKLYAEEESSNDFVTDIKVTVDNPQRHVEAFETYISYKISVESSRTEYTELKYIVRRRYNDFLWLRNKLIEVYPTRLIPPLPNKHSILGQLDRYAKDFIMFRMVMLRRFLSRLVRHPILSYSQHLKIFLTANLTELASYQKANSSGLLTKVSGSIYNMTMMYTVKEKYSEFEEYKKYIIALNEKLVSFEKIMCRMYKERREMTKDMNQLGLEFEKWANSEIILSPLLLSIGLAFSNIGSIHDTLLANPLEYVILQPVREYLIYVESVKEALIRRDNVQIQYESAVEEFHKKADQSAVASDTEKKFFIWKNALVKDNNADFCQDSQPTLVYTAEVNHDKLQIANEDLRSDLERWSVEKKEDIKRILLELSNYYIQYYQKSLNIWEESLRKINVPLNKEC